LLADFASLGVRVVGVSVDPLPKLVKFRDKYELKFPLVSDENRTIGSAFGTLKGDMSSTHERDTLLVDTRGAILLAYQRVGARGHAATVLSDARRLREEGRI
jgi:peroxiredoxin Q/BCP